jgi:hypothetical protein
LNSHKIFVRNHINTEYFNTPIPRTKRTKTKIHIRDQSSNAVRGTVDASQSSARSSDVSTPSSNSGSETTNYTLETVRREVTVPYRESDSNNNNMQLTSGVESTDEGTNYEYIPLSPDNLLSDMDQKGKVEEMVKRICGRRMDKIYSREDLFHMFLRLVVKNVIFKNNWNHKRDSIKYYKYVTVSDEAFAMLVLENHGERYMHMMDGKDEPAPKYTQVKGSSSINKGWSDEGKMRYMELVMETEQWRSENLHKMELLSNYVLKKETAISKKKQCKRSVEDMDDGTTVSSRLEAQTKRKQFEDFLKRSALKRNDSMSFEGASLSIDGGIE